LRVQEPSFGATVTMVDYPAQMNRSAPVEHVCISEFWNGR
jgi:hypothetical protein